MPPRLVDAGEVMLTVPVFAAVILAQAPAAADSPLPWLDTIVRWIRATTGRTSAVYPRPPARLLKRISDIECDRQARGLVLERLERPQDRQSVLDPPQSPDVE
jgi:hypothetical protein